MLWEDNYLAHYGIKGMRWGVRRFQNEDGSLTEEGKRRYKIKEKMLQLYDEDRKSSSNRAKEWDKIAKGYDASSKEGLEKYLKEQFGNDWTDSKYMKDVWEIDDPHKWAKENIVKSQKLYAEDAKAYRQSAAKALKDYKDLKIRDLSDISDKEYNEFIKILRSYGYTDAEIFK